MLTILLLSPSVEGLQQIVTVCEIVISSLGLDLNYRKSVCMRMGPRYLVQCVNIKTINGNVLDWVSELRYLGVFLVSIVVNLNVTMLTQRSLFIVHLMLSSAVWVAV